MTRIPGLSHDKCDARRRIAAMRFNADAVPFRFAGSAPDMPGEFETLQSFGALPATDTEALDAINSRLPQGAPKLSAKDVYIHYYEAGNGNYMADRSARLGETSLMNIASGGTAGVSFMNSHRTGALSEPTELAYGQTFAGRFDVGKLQDKPAMRAMLGVFMRAGIAPNGNSGPSTDDLNKMFQSGALTDVSVGISGCNYTCDVCGNAIGYNNPDAYTVDGEGNKMRKCSHVPGTHRNMTPEQIDAQKAADPLNVKGYASYTMHNGRLTELSAVYDGAVPGAGIRQVMEVAKSGELPRRELHTMLLQAFETYGSVLPFDLSQIISVAPLDEFSDEFAEEFGDDEFFNSSRGVLTMSAEQQAASNGAGNGSGAGPTMGDLLRAPISAIAGALRGGGPNPDPAQSAGAVNPGPPALAAGQAPGQAPGHNGAAAASNSEIAALRSEIARVQQELASREENETKRRSEEQAAREQQQAVQLRADAENFADAIRANCTPAALPYAGAMYQALQSVPGTFKVKGADGTEESYSATQLARQTFSRLGPSFLLGDIPMPSNMSPISTPASGDAEKASVDKARKEAEDARDERLKFAGK